MINIVFGKLQILKVYITVLDLTSEIIYSNKKAKQHNLTRSLDANGCIYYLWSMTYAWVLLSVTHNPVKIHPFLATEDICTVFTSLKVSLLSLSNLSSFTIP